VPFFNPIVSCKIDPSIEQQFSGSALKSPFGEFTIVAGAPIAGSTENLPLTAAGRSASLRLFCEEPCGVCCLRNDDKAQATEIGDFVWQTRTPRHTKSFREGD
jgi:hypothetical protein